MENITTDPGQPTPVGRIVHYVVGAGDLPRLNNLEGNTMVVGDILPAVIVRDWGASNGSVNLKVLTDAPKDFWATSVTYAENLNATELRAAGAPVDYPERTWHWPPRV